MDLHDALIDWDDVEDDSGKTAQFAEHGLSPDEVETALTDKDTRFDVSHSSGRQNAFGETNTGFVQ